MRGGKSKVCALGAPSTPGAATRRPRRPGRAVGAARRTHLPGARRGRSLREPPSPQLPERRKDGAACRENTHSSVWQPSGDSGSSALKREEEEDEEGAARSDAICCTPRRGHWLPGASPSRGHRLQGATLRLTSPGS